jgi:hypothetical protein
VPTVFVLRRQGALLRAIRCQRHRHVPTVPSAYDRFPVVAYAMINISDAYADFVETKTGTHFAGKKSFSYALSYIFYYIF